MTGHIAVVGSLNVDMTLPVDHLPRPGETVLASGPSMTAFGGKGANQAVAAAALGAKVSMIGRVGDDATGRQILDDLARRYIDASAVAITPGIGSGSATIAVDPSGNNVILVDPGANKKLAPADVRCDAVRDAATVIIQLEIPLPAVAAAVQMARGRVMLNPAPAAALPPQILEHVDVLVPNAVELGALAGADAPESVADALQLVRKLAINADVVVTLGSDGALAVPRTGIAAVHVRAPQVHVADATGAGDCFCGALAVCLAGGLDLPSAVRRAVAAASLSTRSPGARAGLPGREEVESLAATLAVVAVDPS